MRYRFVVVGLGASLLFCVSLIWQIGDAIPTCRAIALGDLDGDGDLDAFLANGRHEGVEPNRVWLNDGRGRFSDSGQRLGSNDSRDVTLGDLDGDGDLDVLLSNTWSPPGGEVLENDGRGRLTSRQWMAQGGDTGGSWTVLLSDLDGDGDLDGFVASSGAGGRPAAGGGTVFLPPANLVWLNDGAGSFQDSGQRLGVSGSHGAALGDVDVDVDVDAFVAQWTERADAVWLNDDCGQFADSGQRLGAVRALAAALGDVDGDGDLDALVGNDGPDEVWLNDGVGGFVESGQALGEARTWHVALQDLDGDGDLDALVGREAAAEIWLNDGAGRFSHRHQALRHLPFRAIALGDVDGDGDLDLVAGRARRRPEVWRNDGRGRFGSPYRPWIWVGLGAVAVAAIGAWWLRRQRHP